MRWFRNTLLLVVASLPALAIAQSPAGTPAFDPKSLRGTQEGAITQVLTIGSAHLSQLEKKPTAAELDSLLDKLEAFASFNGPDWYGLPRNSGTITLAKQDWLVPDSYPYISSDSIVPLRAGETLSWKML